MTRILILPLIALLAGCGGESLETAAVAAKAKQEEIRQGEQLQQELRDKLDAAAQQEQQRLNEAAKDQ